MTDQTQSPPESPVLGESLPDGTEVPAKFRGKPFAEVLKSYQELEKARNQPAQPQPPAQPAPRNPLAAPDPTAPGADPFAAFAREIETTGTLSPTSKAQLEQVVGKGRADVYLAGYASIREKAHREAHEVVGGPENYAAMIDWMASGGTTPAEINAFNQAVSSSDPATRALAIRGMYNQYQSQPQHQTPDLVQQGHGGQPVGAYGSRQELSLDQQNPLYRQPGPEGDAFRDKVSRKIMSSRRAKVAGF